MFAFLRRHLELLIVISLLLVPMIIYLKRGPRGREVHWPDRVVVTLAAPVQSAVSWVLRSGRNLGTNYFLLMGAKEEAHMCQVELGQARSQVVSMQERMSESDRLRRALSYVEATPTQELVARIIGMNPEPQFFSIRLNAGEANGVKDGMPVVVPQGVVGYVRRTFGNSCDVMLVQDTDSRIGVVVQRSRVSGLVYGMGPGGLLDLRNVLRSDDVLDGDVLLTSGTDGIYPAGLVLGTVQDVVKNTNGMFLLARVGLAAPVRQLEEVLVILDTVAPPRSP